jgi:hypothetical protein
MGNCTYKLLTGSKAFVITAKPFRGQFVVEVRRKTWGRAGRDGEVLEQRRRASVKKVKLADRASVKHLASLELKALPDLTPIVQQLALLQYDDGQPRQGGYLGVWVNGSAWVVRVTDKDADAQLTAEGRTLGEALELLQLLLGADDAPWEPCSRKKTKRA